MQSFTGDHNSFKIHAVPDAAHCMKMHCQNSHWHRIQAYVAPVLMLRFACRHAAAAYNNKLNLTSTTGYACMHACILHACILHAALKLTGLSIISL